MLAIHKQLSKLGLNNTQVGVDATSFYLSAMYNVESVYLKKETGFAFEPHMNDIYAKSFNDQTFNQDGGESAMLRTKYYNPLNRIFQHLPVKEKV